VAYRQAEVTSSKRLVLDANILLRAVFGSRVRNLLETYEDAVAFYAPDVGWAEARKGLSVVGCRENKPATSPALSILPSTRYAGGQSDGARIGVRHLN